MLTSHWDAGKGGDTITWKAAFPIPVNAVVTEKRSEPLVYPSKTVN